MSRVAELEHENLTLKALVKNLEERLKLALFRQFGRSSEQLVGQSDLPFEDLLAGESPESVETLVVEAHERGKKAGRKALSDSLPRVEYPHELDDNQKTCACGHELERIGEDVNEKLTMVPAQVFVERHI